MGAGTGIGVILGVILGFLGQIGTALLKDWSERRKIKLQNKQSEKEMLYEDRKKSFKKVIDFMNKGINAIEFSQPWDDYWEPLDEKTFDTIRKEIASEFLFLSAEAEKALNLFISTMGETVTWDWEKDPSYDRHKKDIMIRRAYDELIYLSTAITRFLRSQLGITTEVAPILKEISLLKACRFASDSDFYGFRFPNQNILELHKSQSPMDIVRRAKENPDLFKKEFTQFRDFLKTKITELKRPDKISEVDDILKKL